MNKLRSSPLFLLLGCLIWPALAQPPVARDPGTALGWQPEIFGAFTLSLCRDARGGIWVGTEDNGVWNYDAPAKSWHHWTRKEGLGDDTVFALACDGQGRIWAGHLNHGVSVWNGTAWKNYNALSGPLGERVYAIAVCPTDGDVWIATNAGLARYHADREWLYYHRGTGMPVDQLSALAFDAQGNLFAGTQCDGLALASAADNYQSWRSITSPFPRMSQTALGQGLPGNIINDVLVTKDGSLWVATTNGVGRSNDGGKSWSFLRGDNWHGRLRGLYQNPQAPDHINLAAPPPLTDLLLTEDNVNCLAEDAAGHLWIGYNRRGCEVRDTGTNQRLLATPDDAENNLDNSSVRAILPLDGPQPAAIFAQYGRNGLGRAGKVTVSAEAVAAKTAPFPVAAHGPYDLAAIGARLGQLDKPLAPGEGAYLGADWATQGDWTGRYGRSYARLCAMSSPTDHVIATAPGYEARPGIGPHHADYDGPYYYIQWLKSDVPSVLFDPLLGVRRQGEWNDGSWQADIYPSIYDGPDLWTTVHVPEGVHRVSFYFFNKDGHTTTNRFRDYVIELKAHQDNRDATDAATPLAKARVRDFWGGVYQNFVVCGPGDFDFIMRRRGSHVTMMSGVFISKVGTEPGYKDFAPPAAEVAADATSKAAQDLWRQADTALGKAGGAAWDYPARLLAYRALDAKQFPQARARWRWDLPLWNTEDRDDFADFMARTAQALPPRANGNK